MCCGLSEIYIYTWWWWSQRMTGKCVTAIVSCPIHMEDVYAVCYVNTAIPILWTGKEQSLVIVTRLINQGQWISPCSCKQGEQFPSVSFTMFPCQNAVYLYSSLKVIARLSPSAFSPLLWRPYTSLQISEMSQVSIKCFNVWLVEMTKQNHLYSSLQLN